MKINSQTTIGIGLVITLIAAAISFGMMREKVEHLGNDVAEIKSDVKALYNRLLQTKMAVK